MSERVLFVDDESNVLDGIERSLRKQGDLRTASSGAEDIMLLREAGPFALVISDMRMPAMSGAQFLEFDRLTMRGATRESAVDTVQKLSLGLSPQVIKALLSLKVAHQGLIARQVRVKDLAPGMILDEDLRSPKGIRLVPSGQEVTRTLNVRLLSIADGVGVAEPFRVRAPT